MRRRPGHVMRMQVHRQSFGQAEAAEQGAGWHVPPHRCNLLNLSREPLPFQPGNAVLLHLRSVPVRILVHIGILLAHQRHHVLCIVPPVPCTEDDRVNDGRGKNAARSAAGC